MAQHTYTIRPLNADTWDGFADLVERNNGIFGGCWCIGYHPEAGNRRDHQAVKEDRDRTGRAYAALVLDDSGEVQGWAQHGDPEELSGTKHRGQGIARTALEHVVDLVARDSGGRVEVISETTAARVVQSRFPI